MKLTKRIVDAAEPRTARYIVFDDQLPGFGLRVYPSGSKSWIFEYRGGAGGRAADKQRVLLGKASDLTPDQARKAANTLRAAVVHGEDPQAVKSARRKAPTVADIARAFMSDHVEAKRSVGTQVHYRDIVDRIIVPAVGKTKAAELDGAEVAKLHREWKQTPFQANRILATISSMYRFAGSPSQKLVAFGFNPAQGIEKYPERPRQRLLSSDELERLGNALRLAETKGLPWTIRPEKAKSKHLAAPENRATVLSPHVVGAIRLLMFTGARLREILNLRWDQIDFERGLIMLQVHKTARTTGDKAIVLSAPALAVLEALPRIGAYVIAGDKAGTPEEKPRPDLKKPWAAVSAHAGLDDVRLHDLRHHFATVGAGGGMGLPIIGKLLGHAQPQTTARYAHLQADPLRRAADTIGAEIAASMGDGADKDNVVSIRKDKSA